VKCPHERSATLFEVVGSQGGSGKALWLRYRENSVGITPEDGLRAGAGYWRVEGPQEDVWQTTGPLERKVLRK